MRFTLPLIAFALIGLQAQAQTTPAPMSPAAPAAPAAPGPAAAPAPGEQPGAAEPAPAAPMAHHKTHTAGHHVTKHTHTTHKTTPAPS